MTQVNFYALSSGEDEARLRFACRLTEKASAMGHKVFILTENQQQAKLIDELLWQFNPASFVPHALVDEEPASEAVLIGIEAPATQSDVLINLGSGPCPGHQQFSRINEIMTTDEESLVRGRDCYRFYQAQG